MYKTMVAPIVAVLAMGVKLIFNVEIGEELQNQLINVIGGSVAVTISLYGVFKSHDKPKEEE